MTIDPPPPRPASPSSTLHIVDDEIFQAAYGESLASTLDLSTWETDADLSSLYRRLETEVQAAVAMESEMRQAMRREVLPRIARRPHAVREAGVYGAGIDDLAYVHRAVLFNGGVEACDGTSAAHDSLPVTITQIGVCLVNYQGDRGSWLQRLFRRDLRNGSGDPIEDALDLLEERVRRGEGDERQRLTTFARRALMTYAERAILTHRGRAPWRMGHGNPVPVELLTGSGSVRLFNESAEVLRTLILDHRRFVFVPSTPADRLLLTIGDALRPLEYAVVDSAHTSLMSVASEANFAPVLARRATQLIDDVGEVMVRGVFRASHHAPPRVFYCHVDHVHEAALIALADSALQEHRGFPLLIDLADTLCRTTFGNDVFKDAVEAAYAGAGTPFRYLPERTTRP